MSAELRLPNISGTDEEQLAQIRSYLYQLIPQLQWMFQSMSISASVQKDGNTEVCCISIKSPPEDTFTLELTSSGMVFKKNNNILWKK